MFRQYGRRVYDLPHTYAPWLLHGGVSLAEVGHVSAQTTQIYAHLAKKPSDAVLAAISAPRAAVEGSEREGR